jgi:hypothetical protein
MCHLILVSSTFEACTLICGLLILTSDRRAWISFLKMFRIGLDKIVLI